MGARVPGISAQVSSEWVPESRRNHRPSASGIRSVVRRMRVGIGSLHGLGFAWCGLKPKWC